MKKLTKQQIALTYIMYGFVHRGRDIPREGFYWIREILDVKFNTRIELLQVVALYHPAEPIFEDSPEVPAQLSSLFNKYSDGPKEYIRDIQGSVIHIKSVKMQEYEFDGKPQKRYNVSWDIIKWIDNDSQIVNVTNDSSMKQIQNQSSELNTDNKNDEEEENLCLDEEHLTQAEIEYYLDQWENENWFDVKIEDGKSIRISQGELECLLNQWEEDNQDVPEALEDLKKK